MKIVIDLQGLQTTGSRNRGIGRYSLALTKAILKNYSNKHTIIILLSGLFLDTILEIKSELKNLISDENIKIWNGLKNISYIENEYSTKKKVSEILRNDFITSLNPDAVLVTSLVEGLMDDAVITVDKKTNYLTASILYDLIPHIYPTKYLAGKTVQDWYSNRIDHLNNSDILLAISNSSKEEGCKYLKVNPDNIVNISTAANSFFKKIAISESEKNSITERLQISSDFLMYTGGIDFRKNIENLIIAYSHLPLHIKNVHQLAIVCSITESDKQKLKELAKNNNIAKDRIIFTGYVSDKDLLYLYNLCKLFVFPSFHEGFGLPVLEAMSCAKAVIGSNITSVPEVIGNQEALFDPYDIKSIADKINQVLSDDNFRIQLEQHSENYSKNFTWDKTAKTAIKTIESMHDKKKQYIKKQISKPKLAFLSPLPPEKSGISDYSFELLPELAKYYEIDLISEENIKLLESLKSYKLKSVEYFKENYTQYNRVLYHIGNSHFHKHMFLLLKEYPGVVVLHDFFLSDIVAHIELTQYKQNFLNESLYNSHGYKAIFERFENDDLEKLLYKYPINLDILQQSRGIIMHSEKSKTLFQKYYNTKKFKDFDIIPLLRAKAIKKEKKNLRKILKLPEDAFVIASFGTLGETKLNLEVIKAFINSSLIDDENCYLVFVGECFNKLYYNDLLSTSSKFKSKIIFTNWVNQETYQNYLNTANMAVQLRTNWRGETSAAVLDCMNYGVPTIVNANGSMEELPKDAVLMIEDNFSIEELTCSLENLRNDSHLREMIIKNAAKLLELNHRPEYCGKLYFKSIEKFYNNKISLQNTIEKLVDFDDINDQTMCEAAVSLSYNYPLKFFQKQIFVDITALVIVGAKTGIQRTVRNILKNLLLNPPLGYKIEPVYSSANREGYMYARRYTLEFLKCPKGILLDEPIDIQKGDIFLGLDLVPLQVKANKRYFQFLRSFGVEVKFVVYDLISVLFPSLFNEQDAKNFKEWLDVIIENDGAISISNDVSVKLQNWLQKHHPEKIDTFQLDSFQLGADFKNDNYSYGVCKATKNTIDKMKKNISFLMVGTIEPRKAHEQVLKSFEKLWEENSKVNLVIVGKKGWLSDELIQKIENHSKLGQQLHWLKNISDEALELLYTNSSALIAASFSEGFGLPLIEAAKYKLPIIARDIPVFREVADVHAFYFEDTKESSTLSNAIKNWINLYHLNKHPKSDAMKYVNWNESTAMLIDILTTKR